MMGKKQVVTMDAMGAYTSAIEFVVDNPRTLLLGRVAPKFASMREEAEEKVRIARENKAKSGGDPKRAQLDMVQGRRQRFVDFKVHTYIYIYICIYLLLSLCRSASLCFSSHSYTNHDLTMTIHLFSCHSASAADPAHDSVRRHEKGA